MIRKLILPAIAVLLLAGCASGYTYRTAPGDYYYGQSRVIYRDTYGYPGYGSYYSPYGWGGYYGYSRGYRYGYPYYRWSHHGGHQHKPRPGHGNGHGNGNDHDQDRTPDRSNPPWRDLGQVTHRPQVPQGGVRTRPQVRRPAPVQRPRPTRHRPSPVQAAPRAPVRQGGSRMSEMIRKARSN